MSPTPRNNPFPLRRGLAALAGLAAVTALANLGRGTRPVLSTAVSDGGAGAAVPPHGTTDRATDRHRPTSHGPHSSQGSHRGDTAPGEERQGETDIASGVRAYLIGLGLAALLTAGSFYLSYTGLVYGPGVPVALIVFAVAQIGVHLVFFLHLTTSPDNINNAMALAFGTLIVVLLIGGTLWIMMHMNQNMMPMSTMPPSGMAPMHH